MTRRLLPLVAALAIFVAACGDDDDTEAATGDDVTAQESSTTSTTAASSSSAEDGYPAGGSDSTTAPDEGSGSAVTIADFTYDPSPIEVSAGDTVTWTNDDGVAHTVTAGTPEAPGDTFDEKVDAGASAEVTFDEAGTFSYFCAIHPTMTGEVVVS